MKGLLLLVFLFSFAEFFAKDLFTIENELVTCVKKINDLKTRPFTSEENFKNFDSLYNENARLKALLLDYTITAPGTISYPFDSLRRYIDIASSDDNKLRIYSWYLGRDEEDMGFFINIFQYEAQGVVYSTMINYDDAYDPKGYYSDIHTAKMGEDTTIYMGYFHAFYTLKDYSESYQTYQIVGNQLVDSIPIFKMRDSIMSSIEVLFQPLSQKKYMRKLIHYYPDKKKIRIRQTDNNGILLTKYSKLIFNGKQFEYLIED